MHKQVLFLFLPINPIVWTTTTNCRQWRIPSNLTFATSFIVAYLPTWLAPLGNTQPLAMTPSFIGFPYSFLLASARWPSLYWRLHKWESSWGPHILTINGINDGLIACLVCADFVAVIGVFLSCHLIEEYAWNCMAAWNTSDVSFPTSTCPLLQVHNETL